MNEQPSQQPYELDEVMDTCVKQAQTFILALGSCSHCAAGLRILHAPPDRKSSLSLGTEATRAAGAPVQRVVYDPQIIYMETFDDKIQEIATFITALGKWVAFYVIQPQAVEGGDDATLLAIRERVGKVLTTAILTGAVQHVKGPQFVDVVYKFMAKYLGTSAMLDATMVATTEKVKRPDTGRRW